MLAAMELNNLYKTKDAASYLASEDARLRLIKSDPRYIEPTISSMLFLCFRLLFDQWHDTGGGNTQIFGVYEACDESNESCVLRHVIIERGAFGRFDLETGLTINDKVIKKDLIKSIEQEYIELDLPAIRDGSSDRTNTNYVEVEWFFNRNSRQAGWTLPNHSMTKLYDKLRKLADRLIAIKSP